MGFPEGHTKFNGVAEIAPRDRRKMLGNSFQIDNIVYLLHVLKVCTAPDVMLNHVLQTAVDPCGMLRLSSLDWVST